MFSFQEVWWMARNTASRMTETPLHSLLGARLSLRRELTRLGLLLQTLTYEEMSLVQHLSSVLMSGEETLQSQDAEEITVLTSLLAKYSTAVLHRERDSDFYGMSGTIPADPRGASKN